MKVTVNEIKKFTPFDLVIHVEDGKDYYYLQAILGHAHVLSTGDTYEYLKLINEALENRYKLH